MIKASFTLTIAIIASLWPVKVSAKQTIQEATDSIKNILTLANEGDAAAQNEVGGWYYRGRHVTQNYEEALQWWAKAAKQGNVEAIGNMGLCYRTGNGVTADSLRAIQLYQSSIKKGNMALFNQNVELAKEGNIFSNMLVANCYQNGIGVQKNAADAIPYLTRAAELNCLPAQRDLALLLLNGKKADEAAKWFKKGADNNDLTCTFYYGKLLHEGLGIKQDMKEGANYLLKAADSGFPQAMFYVGDCYMKGEGLTKNAEQALKWYKLAAGKGVHNAQWALAECFRQGIGTPINYERALYWYAHSLPKGHTRNFKKLINDSIPDSPFVAYLNGIKAYNDNDFQAALNQFKTVKKAKVEDGTVMEAALLANSEYPAQNIKKSVKMLEKSAKTNPQAMYLLAVLYEAGNGVNRNMSKAVELMTTAADLDYGAALCALADMYFEGRGVEQSYDKAVELYGIAEVQGQLNLNAAKRYASCYENGWGVSEKDTDKATALLQADYNTYITDLLKLL